MGVIVKRSVVGFGATIGMTVRWVSNKDGLCGNNEAICPSRLRDSSIMSKDSGSTC